MLLQIKIILTYEINRLTNHVMCITFTLFWILTFFDLIFDYKSVQRQIERYILVPLNLTTGWIYTSYLDSSLHHDRRRTEIKNYTFLYC